MGRKDFIADVNAASKGPLIPNIGNLQMGEDGESFSFQFNHGYDMITTVRALMTDNSSYPRDNTYFLSAENNAMINEALQEIQYSLEGLTIKELVAKVSDIIESLGYGTAGSPMRIDTPPGSLNGARQSSEGSGTSEPEDDEDEDEFPEDYDAHDWFGTVSTDEFNEDAGVATDKKRQIDSDSAAKLNKRILDDLKHLRMAGFRVGIIKGMKADSTNGLLSISLRIAKLGLSDEVLQAWNLERHHYIVLLIQYSNGYETLEDVLAKPVRDVKVSFRMGINNRYKPTLEEAIAAFSAVKRSNIDPFAPGHRRDGVDAGSRNPTEGSRSRFRSPTRESSPRKKRFGDELLDNEVDLGFRLCFISSPMRQLMDELFFHLVKIRHVHNCGWEGAKHHLREQNYLTQLADKHEYVHIEEIPSMKDLPDIVTADHLKDEGEKMSLPLVAMQFVMLYLMRCTEFCLVCHKKTEESIEALKPYVCSDPLCLYQYMFLGFGPSIEHEILTQPYVVDLLISFCYAAASADRLRGYPDGMGLAVPPPPPGVVEGLINRLPLAFPVSVDMQRLKEEVPINEYCNEWLATEHTVHHDRSCRLIELEQGDVCQYLRSGDWIQLTVDDPSTSYGKKTVHCRVEKYMHPFIHIVDVLELKTPKLGATPDLLSGEWALRLSRTEMKGTETSEPTKKDMASKLDKVGLMSMYNLHFDHMEGPIKAAIIVELLQTLPSVREMAEYLSQNGASEARLMGWVDRISPAALGLLRWIVASNRSCIVQVDQAPGQSSIEAINRGVRLEQRLTGMSNWMQFRFAQGAPDKEDKFHKALAIKKNVTGKYESIFAWHGSSVANWHSIIRNGLDFEETLNGRAFGHGVYFATEFATSLGYCNAFRLATSVSGGVKTHISTISPSPTKAAVANTMMQPGTSVGAWPQSSLQICAAICLNEIVNSPAEFMSQDPYLVVQFTEWIQCRYLLVQCVGHGNPDDTAIGSMFSTKKNDGKAQTAKQMQDAAAEQKQMQKKDPSGPFIVQDPTKYITHGYKRIMIPRSAFQASRNFMASKDGSPSHETSMVPFVTEDGFEDNTPRKKRKSADGGTLTLPLISKVEKLRDDFSDDSDFEDIAFFHSEDEVKTASQSLSGLGFLNTNGHTKNTVTHDEYGMPLTDFVPGSLDRSTIQQLTPPLYGSSSGNRRLQQDLRALLSVQNSTPLYELGWYIDGDSISNLYQWIVELHSFPSELPLAKDMKKAEMKSIVLELRFGQDYPMEPPFVRVIRPRFLSFMHGGGGHVTAGGALCMELLTNSGWSAVSTIESVLLQVRMAIMSTDPNPARLMSQAGYGGGGGDYSVHEAVEAYERACKMHGWAFPNMRGVGGDEVLSIPRATDRYGGDGTIDADREGDLMSLMGKRKGGGISALA